MPFSPAHRALDRARSIAFMRNFYASLGMSRLTLERAIRHIKGVPVAPLESAPTRRVRRPRRK
jgi:hypothetical protein